MVKGKGGDESADGRSVHDKKQRTENGPLGDATGGGVEGKPMHRGLTLTAFDIDIYRQVRSQTLSAGH